MAIPRSTANRSVAPAAVRNPAANDTFSSIAAGATTLFTFALPRSFKPQKPIDVVFPAGLQTGLNAGWPYITGNSPTYSVNIPIQNSTGGALTPTAQKVVIQQS